MIQAEMSNPWYGIIPEYTQADIVQALQTELAANVTSYFGSNTVVGVAAFGKWWAKNRSGYEILTYENF